MIELIGFIFTSILGTIGHFIYDWTKLKIFKFLFAKDESLYSHLKLGITPMLLFMFVENKYFLNNSIIFIKGYSIMLFIIIISLVYLFGIIIKKEISSLNISSFYIATFLSYVVSFLLFNKIYFSIYIKYIGYILFGLIILSYFTINFISSKDD